MAYIQPRKDKDGNIISYSVRVFKGYAPDGSQLKPYTASFKPDPNKTDRQNEKALNKFAVDFEEKCRSGLVADSRQTFAEYAEYVIGLKERAGAKHKTILEYHHFISVVLEQADKEMLIPFNPARKATPPKQKPHTANYFQIEDVERIRDCLELEPLKWRTFVHLLLISGARRGEIAGLKWDVIDWRNSRIHIQNNLLYAPDRGIYEEATKTEESDRFVTLPAETMELLKEYRKWYLVQASNYGDQWHNTNYLFFQEKTGNAGKPMHPDTINGYLDRFSERYHLPHINPHAFRHTMASVLYFNKVDSISISKRLGHSKVSTTTDIYSHIMKEADKQSAECIANVILRPKTDPCEKKQNKTKAGFDRNQAC